jgi:hypothetical protein
MIFKYVSFLAYFIQSIYASECDCQQVSSWEEFRQTILRANQNMVDEGQVLVKLCPFSIEKVHNADTNFLEFNVPITRPMHIACEKNSNDDVCEISIVGPSCGIDQDCGKHLFAIRSGTFIFACHFD